MKPKKYIFGTYCVKTDIGKVRMTNEDRALALTNAYGNILLVVCDGMGGSAKGEYAATLATSMFEEAFSAKTKFHNTFEATSWLRKWVRKINTAIYDESEKNAQYKGMGTTLSLALIVKDTMVLVQIGDSRIYSLRHNMLLQLTEDQTLVNYLFHLGKITKEEMATHPKRHVLMNALGIYPTIDMELKKVNYMNESIMVCSDGLYNNVSETDITTILKSNDSTSQKVNELISLANANGGSDNIAVALWEANE